MAADEWLVRPLLAVVPVYREEAVKSDVVVEVNLQGNLFDLYSENSRRSQSGSAVKAN